MMHWLPVVDGIGLPDYATVSLESTLHCTGFRRIKIKLVTAILSSGPFDVSTTTELFHSRLQTAVLPEAMQSRIICI